MAYNPTSRPDTLDDEVNLIELWLKFVKVLRSYFLLVLLLIGTGALLGWVSFLRTPPTFKSRMIANSSVLNNVEVVAIVENWQEMLGKGERKLLAKKLGISEGLLQELRAIEIEENKGGVDGFTIEVIVTDNSALDNVQKALIAGFANNSYVKERVILRLNTLKSLVNEINQQIGSLERKRISIDGMLTDKDSPKTGRIIMDPSSINVQIVTLKEKRLELEEKIVLINDLQIVESFSASDVPESPKLFKNIALGVVLGLMAAFILITVILLKNKITSYQAELGS